MNVSFYLPETEETYLELPKSVAEYWAWQSAAVGLFPYWGRYHWVLQTYLYLKDAGLPVRLTNDLSSEGFIVTHMDCVDYGFRPGSRQILVIMLVDREVPHPHAHLHITHNPVQVLPFGIAHLYMPPWPQIGLVPRLESRGPRFESIGYFGYPHNLDPGIADPSFMAEIARLGLRLEVPPPTAWHDFSQIDCVLAVRNFGRAQPLLHKPSLKLYNAWLAGVPAILGFESACRHEGNPGVGYIEVTSATELLTAIEKLKADGELRARIVAHGSAAVTRYLPNATIQRWRDMLSSRILTTHRNSSSSLNRLNRKIVGAVLERLLWRFPGRFSQCESDSPQ